MPSYNVQKVKTLERLTRFGVSKSTNIIKFDLTRRVEQIFNDLNSGVNTLQNTNLKRIKDPMDTAFESHEFLTVRSAVSDGIQEVTPSNELGLWRLLPDCHDPIFTLTDLRPQLGDKRDKIAKGFIKKTRKLNKFSIAGLRNLFLTDYLKILRTGYRDLASDWIAGDSTIEDVKNMLGITFGKTKAESNRIFRTETTNYFVSARADYFIENTSMDFMQIFSITDGRRSKICEDRHGWVFPIAEATQRAKKPAFHPYCRTIQRPLTSRLKSHRRLIDIGLAMNESSFTDLPVGWA